MQQKVLDKTTRPHIITAHELSDSLFSLLPRGDGDWMDEDAVDDIFPSFLNRVRSLVTERSSRPFAVSQLPVRSTMTSPAEAIAAAFDAGLNQSIDDGGRNAISEFLDENAIELWSGFGIAISTCGTGSPDVDREFASKRVSSHPHLVYVRATGRTSPGAMDLLHFELAGVIRSLVRSARVAAEANESEDWSPLHPTGLPIADFELLKRETQFIRVCLDGYFASPTTKKDSLDRRIRNAITLLVEADAQSNPAIGISLSVTAVEALLGSGKESISKTVSERTAILLEPELVNRVAAEDYMKHAYNDRSRALHGEKLEAEAGRREEIRKLAAGVLYSLISFREFIRRGGFNPQTPDELMQQLHDLKYVPGQPIGVPELQRVSSLWRTRQHR